MLIIIYRMRMEASFVSLTIFSHSVQSIRTCAANIAAQKVDYLLSSAISEWKTSGNQCTKLPFSKLFAFRRNISISAEPNNKYKSHITILNRFGTEHFFVRLDNEHDSVKFPVLSMHSLIQPQCIYIFLAVLSRFLAERKRHELWLLWGCSTTENSIVNILFIPANSFRIFPALICVLNDSNGKHNGE